MATKKELSQYQSLRAEVKLLEEQAAERKKEYLLSCKTKSQVSDTVQGSSADWPYCLHTMTIEGVSREADNSRDRTRKAAAAAISRLWSRKAECEEELIRMEKYIDSIQDTELRQIMELRYLSGNGRLLRWAEVAKKMGPGMTEDCVRKKHDRFLCEN